MSAKRFLVVVIEKPIADLLEKAKAKRQCVGINPY